MVVMATASFRFYEELNDFLPPSRRKRDFGWTFAPGATVKHAIEAQGVPHTEVDLILANGESVGFSYVVREGDRISVYPMFEALDIMPVLRLRPEPLRRTRFVADAHLGGLAKYLRMLGFDTLHAKADGDAEIARLGAAEQRIVLTRDRALLMHRQVTRGCFVREARPRRQLVEIVSRLDLVGAFRPFSRCMVCNCELRPVAEDTIRDRLPPGAASVHDPFRICDGCGRIYWKGSHWRRMDAFVHELVNEIGWRRWCTGVREP
jgi:uncharacterized protein with PIN domain